MNYLLNQLFGNSEQFEWKVIRKVTRILEYYNLDMIISVGYRVNSKRGVQFRQWSTGVLKEYLLKGYAINQRVEQLENKGILMTGNWKS